MHEINWLFLFFVLISKNNICSSQPPTSGPGTKPGKLTVASSADPNKKQNGTWKSEERRGFTVIAMTLVVFTFVTISFKLILCYINIKSSTKPKLKKKKKKRMGDMRDLTPSLYQKLKKRQSSVPSLILRSRAKNKTLSGESSSGSSSSPRPQVRQADVSGDGSSSPDPDDENLNTSEDSTTTTTESTIRRDEIYEENEISDIDDVELELLLSGAAVDEDPLDEKEKYD